MAGIDRGFTRRRIWRIFGGGVVNEHNGAVDVAPLDAAALSPAHDRGQRGRVHRVGSANDVHQNPPASRSPPDLHDVDPGAAPLGRMGDGVAGAGPHRPATMYLSWGER